MVRFANCADLESVLVIEAHAYLRAAGISSPPTVAPCIHSLNSHLRNKDRVYLSTHYSARGPMPRHRGPVGL